MEFLIAIAGFVALAIVSYLFAPDERMLAERGEHGSWAPLEVGPAVHSPRPRRIVRPVDRAA